MAELPADDIVATLDPELVKTRIRSILESAEKNEAERTNAERADAAAARYRALAQLWSEPPLSYPLERVAAPRPRASALEIIDVAGTIKWFDARLGYGFIAPDRGGDDILLHVTCLRASGYQTAHEGARVHCEALRRPRGIQAFRILAMDNSTAVHPSLRTERTSLYVEPQSGWEKAVVKWFNRVRGFGFLTVGEPQADIYVHVETLRRFGFAGLTPGQVVEVRWGLGSKGRMAAELRPPAGTEGCFTRH